MTMNSPAILELKVIRYGVYEEHKVKAALSSDEILTLYISTNKLGVHSTTTGGMGQMPTKEYAHPAIIHTMQEAYNAGQ